MSFREVSRSMRGQIWLMAVSTLLIVIAWGPVEAYGGNISAPTVVMGIVSALLFVWAWWASVPAKKPPGR